MLRLLTPLIAAGLLAAPLVTAGSAQASALPPQTYAVQGLKLDGLFASVTITTRPDARGITISANGPDEPVSRIKISTDRTSVTVHQDHRHLSRESDPERVSVTITVPADTPLAVDDFIGSVQAGDLGDVAIAGLHSGQITTGAIGNGVLTITGSGDITVGGVRGNLQVTIDGSGSVKTGATHAAVGLAVNGSGTIEVARVDGPVSAAVNGSGDILIRDGKANPLAVELAGSGDFTLHGEASSQSIRRAGSGRVTISH